MAKKNGSMHSSQQRSHNEQRQNPGQQGGATGDAGARQQRQNDSHSSGRSSSSKLGKGSGQQR